MRAERSSLKGAAASLYSILSSSSFALYLTHLTSIDLDGTKNIMFRIFISSFQRLNYPSKYIDWNAVVIPYQEMKNWKNPPRMDIVLTVM